MKRSLEAMFDDAVLKACLKCSHAKGKQVCSSCRLLERKCKTKEAAAVLIAVHHNVDTAIHLSVSPVDLVHPIGRYSKTQGIRLNHLRLMLADR